MCYCKEEEEEEAGEDQKEGLAMLCNGETSMRRSPINRPHDTITMRFSYRLLRCYGDILVSLLLQRMLQKSVTRKKYSIMS